ncbi:MAG: DUF2933 domain-containing protein [Burkholderiaceae bacterium]|nr:DUF2933 domain-containing protein [Burkholderiaceae bacterium]
MTNRSFQSHHAPGPRAQRGAALPWVFFGFLAVAGFFFFAEHRAHLLGALPFVLLALCPLMHLFHRGHGGHGSHQGHGSSRPEADGRSSPPTPPTAARPPHQH